MILLFAMWASASEACPAPTRAVDVRAALDTAYASLEGLDIAAFKGATDQLDAAVPCLSEPLTPGLVAEVHRTKGIRAFGERDSAGAQQMFAAARTIEPGFRFPYNLIPDGNPIRDAYLALDLGARTTEELPPPGRGDLRFDGYTSRARPTSWPTVVQHVQADGTVSFTAYLAPGDPVPAYPLEADVPDPAVVVVPMPSGELPPLPPPPPPKEHRARIPLWIAAGVTAVGSGVAYGMADAGQRRFTDPTTPDADLDGLRARTNTLVVISGFGAAATAGLTIAGAAAK